MVNAFVTGASGYVGQNIVKALVARGHKVSGLVRSPSAARSLSDRQAQPVLGDLQDPECYRQAALSADVIIHAGFAYSDDGDELIHVDEMATKALLDFAASDGKPRGLIYTSSLFRYVPSTGEIFDESNSRPRDPSDWRHCVSELVLNSANEVLATAVIPLAWVYGGGGGTLADAIAPLTTGELPQGVASNRIPLVHVEDLADLYVTVAEQSLRGIFHGCSSLPLTVEDLRDIATRAGLSRSVAVTNDGHFGDIFRTDTPASTLHGSACSKSDLIQKVFLSLSRPVEVAA